MLIDFDSYVIICVFYSMRPIGVGGRDNMMKCAVGRISQDSVGVRYS